MAEVRVRRRSLLQDDDFDVAFLQLLLRNSREGVVLLSRRGIIQESNRAVHHFFGLDPLQTIGRHFLRFLAVKHLESPLEVIEEDLWQGGSWQGYLALRDGRGRVVKSYAKLSVMLPDVGCESCYYLCQFTPPPTVGLGIDANAGLPGNDMLTGLPNRMLFEDRLRQAIHQARRRGLSLGVMMADIDRFTILNDTLGREVGDGLLAAVGYRLAQVLRTSDTVARVGSDSFALLLGDIGDHDDAARNAGMLARKVMEMVGEPIMVGDKRLDCTLSLGITLFPQDGETAELLLHNAESALTHARRSGLKGIEFFSAKMGASARLRFEMENSLRQAMENNGLRLFYQPQVNIASGCVVGVEALARWPCPERGMISPGEFIPVAEESGLIVPLGTWVLRTACQQYAKWMAMGLGPVRIGVNISAIQFQRQNLPALIDEVIAETGIPPEYLELEITESAIMDDVEHTIEVLNEINARGVNFSIDDFGTGYSSLSYLRRFPVKTLKIDRSFVSNLGENESDSAIVHAIIAMAHSLKMNVIAEGLETGVQLSIMHKLRCNEMQGFLFSRPLPEAEMTELLRLGRRMASNESETS